MGSLADIHKAGLDLIQSLVLDKKEEIKNCLLMYPNTALSDSYKNKRFIVECLVSKIDQSRLKADNTVYSSDDVEIIMLYSDIANVLDRTNTVVCPNEDFKINNVLVKYDGKKYVIKEESMGELENSVNIICELKS